MARSKHRHRDDHEDEMSEKHTHQHAKKKVQVIFKSPVEFKQNSPDFNIVKEFQQEFGSMPILVLSGNHKSSTESKADTHPQWVRIKNKQGNVKGISTRFLRFIK